MTDTQWTEVLRNVRRRIERLGELPPAEQRKRLRILKAELKTDYKMYYVEEYTVKRHLRRLPKRRRSVH